MGNAQSWCFGEVAFEVTDRAGASSEDLPVYGVDKSIGLTSEPRYQSKNLQRYKRIDHGMFAYNPMRLNIGSIGFCFEDIPPGLVSPDYVVFACDPKRLLPKFCYYHTQSSPWKSWLSLAGEGSVRERIYFKKLAAYEVELPPITYQQAAVEILSSLDDKIELNRRMNEALEGAARALFRDWFVDFGPTRRQMEGATDPVAIMGGAFPAEKAASIAPLFPAVFGDDDLPEGWRVQSIYEYAKVIYGAPFKSKRFNNVGVGRPLARIRDLPKNQAGQYTDEVHKKEHLMRPGDVVVGMDGEFRSYLWHGVPTLMNQRVCSFEPINARDRAFVWLAIKPWLRFFESTAIATTVIHLGKGDIDTFEIVDGGDEVKAAFSAILEPVASKIVANGQESQTLAEIRDLLLPKLMSGEICVGDVGAAG